MIPKSNAAKETRVKFHRYMYFDWFRVRLHRLLVAASMLAFIRDAINSTFKWLLSSFKAATVQVCVPIVIFDKFE